MSKQQGYQHLNTEYAPDGEEDYGFAARLPQAGGSYQTDKASSGSGAAGVPPMYPPTYPPTHPAPAYAGAPVTGYPVMTPSTAGGMAGPAVGLGSEDPLGRRGGMRARRQGRRMAGGAQGGGKRKPPPVLKLLVGGPVHLLLGLVRRAMHSGKGHVGKQSPASANHPSSSN